MLRRIRLLTIVALLGCPGLAYGGDWLQWGGPRGDFTVAAEGIAEWWPGDGPTTLWSRPLGEGYSSILAADGVLYTLYSVEDEEIVVALDAVSGKTLWEHRYTVKRWDDMDLDYGPGPNATPLIVGDRIVAAGIDGQLRGLDLATGELRFKHDLPELYGRRERDEEYGYSASPIAYGDLAIVLVGGTDHAVIAFDPSDGSVAWKSAPGGVSYAQPTVAELGGRDHFVYFSPEGVDGLDPQTGETLWHHDIDYDNGNHLTPIVRCSDEHIWVGSQFASGGGRLLAVRPTDDGWTVEEEWFEPRLRASHWTSIRIGDLIYGSIGGNEVSVFTAFDWRTGKIVWRRRGFHQAQTLHADGKLLMYDEDGQLTLARVSPQGMEVLDTFPVTDSLSWTLPTLVDTTLYLRDKTHIFAFDLSRTGGPRTARSVARTREEKHMPTGTLAPFVASLEDRTDKQAAVDAFLAKQERVPIVDDDSTVHFVYNGDVPDIAVTGNFLPRNTIEPMYHVEGTDFWFRSVKLPPASYFEYRFDVLEESLPDPLNERRMHPDAELTVVTTRGWSEPAYLAEPDGPRGRLDTFDWKSAALENDREITVWLPPGYDRSKKRYPLVIVNYGDDARSAGGWETALDNLVDDEIRPVIVAFVPRVDFSEYAAEIDAFTTAIATELLPTLDGKYRTREGPKNRLLTGFASSGFASVYIGLARPDAIGHVAALSFYFRSEAADTLRDRITKGDNTTARFYLHWSTNDFNGNGDLQSEKSSEELAALLLESDYDVTTAIVDHGAGWGHWRTATADLLRVTFPARTSRR